MMWAALNKVRVLAFGLACIVAVLLSILFYHRINARFVSGLATLKQKELVLRAANGTPWHHPSGTRCHVFMGVTLPETGDCNPPLSGRVSTVPNVFPMPETSMVIYNRVSKSGSTTVKKIIASLKGSNQFHSRVSHIYDKRRVKDSKQVRHERTATMTA